MREATEEVEDGLNQMPRPENKGRGFGYPAGRLCQPAFVYVTHVVRTTQKPSAAKAEGAMNTVAAAAARMPRSGGASLERSRLVHIRLIWRRLARGQHKRRPPVARPGRRLARSGITRQGLERRPVAHAIEPVGPVVAEPVDHPDDRRGRYSAPAQPQVPRAFFAEPEALQAGPATVDAMQAGAPFFVHVARIIDRDPRAAGPGERDRRDWHRSRLSWFPGERV